MALASRSLWADLLFARASARRVHDTAGLMMSTNAINLHNLVALAPDAHAAINDSAGLIMSTIGINLYNPISLGRDTRAAMNRTAIKPHRINPVGRKPHQWGWCEKSD